MSNYQLTFDAFARNTCAGLSENFTKTLWGVILNKAEQRQKDAVRHIAEGSYDDDDLIMCCEEGNCEKCTVKVPTIAKYLTTFQMCIEFLEYDGMLLQWVPEHLKSFEMRMAAVRQNGLALQFDGSRLYEKADSQYEGLRVRMAAVEQNGMALQFVQTMNQTEGICCAALKQDMDAFRYCMRMPVK